MNRARWLIFALLILALSACGTGNSAPTTGANTGAGNTNDQASNQFLTDRNGGTPVAGGTTGMNAPTIGIVQQVQGTTIKLLDPMSKQEKSIQLAPNATISMQGDIKASDIQAGDEITAVGTQSGDAFQASMVQVGKTGMMGGPVVIGGAPAGSSGGNQLAGSGGNAAPLPGGGSSISGTVDQAQGEKIVVKTSDGKSVTVQLASGAQIRKQLQIKPEQIETGKLVVANGTQNGSTFEASSLEVLPAPPAP